MPAAPILLPDGVATLEFYDAESATAAGLLDIQSMMVRPLSSLESCSAAMSDPDGVGTPGRDGAGRSAPSADSAHPSLDDDPASRLEHVARASVLVGLEDVGRVPGFGCSVWAVGRVAGAEGYLESLRSGVRVAERVLGVLGVDTVA